MKIVKIGVLTLLLTRCFCLQGNLYADDAHTHSHHHHHQYFSRYSENHSFYDADGHIHQHDKRKKKEKCLVSHGQNYLPWALLGIVLSAFSFGFVNKKNK
jgi:hypothetical protein